MLDLNNLYWEDKQNIDSIKSTAQQIWGEDCTFGEIKVIDSPYPEFEWPLMLYGQTEALLTYDRSLLRIDIKKDDEYVYIRKLTDKQIIGGFDSCKRESLVNNFSVLDELVREKNRLGDIEFWTRIGLKHINEFFAVFGNGNEITLEDCRRGDIYTAVETLQWALNILGYQVREDGMFSKETKHAYAACLKA